MNGPDVLVDALGRVPDLVHDAVGGLDPDDLNVRLDGSANSIGWLIWHLTRVQDDHVAEVAGRPQVWIADGWTDRFGLPFDDRATGWSQTSAEVDSARFADPGLLTGYYDAVHAGSLAYLAGLAEADLDRVVDDRWDPPVTLGVRLISVVDDCLEHVAQAHFIRGVLERRAT